MVGNDRVDARSECRLAKRQMFQWPLGHKPSNLGKTDMTKGDTKTLSDTNRLGEAIDLSQISLFLGLF
jgi:hypothetical protein